MPPNLGGFFMVRSYYPSECHADYFDFERIEALKPAIEACGISTLSQSPMLGFHKQMDNRIKLLEEILSFRMQGVEFDNGDMYVDGHKVVFFQAEDGIRVHCVTGVQTCALPIWAAPRNAGRPAAALARLHNPPRAAAGRPAFRGAARTRPARRAAGRGAPGRAGCPRISSAASQIGRASWRERGKISVGAVSLKKK